MYQKNQSGNIPICVLHLGFRVSFVLFQVRIGSSKRTVLHSEDVILVILESPSAQYRYLLYNGVGIYVGDILAYALGAKKG